MSSPTANQQSPVTFLRLTPEASIAAAPQSTFLSLAPSTSSSYPRAQSTRSSVDSATEPIVEPAQTPRRSSSASGPRVLKLGPVHWGEHLDEHKDDFHLASSL